MKYIELKLTITPDTEQNKEIVAATLAVNGYYGFIFEENIITAYINEPDFDKTFAQNIKNIFKDINIEITYNKISDQNWNETWTLNYFKPLVIADKLLVHASFHTDLPKTEYRIEIDPKTAFGTGNHATTFMIMEQILNIDINNKKVLDMGCGTGILAILSKMKGAAYTLAVDNDPAACLNTKENIIINNTPDIQVLEGNSHSLTNQMFDIIYENIWKNTVIADLPVMYKHLTPGGTLITSGYYAKEAQDVIDAGINSGFLFTQTQQNNEWATVIFKKK